MGRFQAAEGEQSTRGRKTLAGISQTRGHGACGSQVQPGALLFSVLHSDEAQAAPQHPLPRARSLSESLGQERGRVKGSESFISQ